MTGTLAQTIQGEAGGNPAAQFAVAATIYNRMQSGSFPGGTNPTAIVNAPSQFTGYAANPNASARQFAAAIENGTLPQYGNVGNAVNFGDSTIRATAQGTNIGGNYFSDNWGPPTANFVAPQYGGNYSNFTPPSSAPDQFSISDTPGSQANHLINDPGAGGFGADNQTPGGIDPVTGQPDVILPDVNAGAPAQFQSGPSTGGTSPTGAQAQSGQGTPVQVNLGPQTATDFQSWVNAPINAAEKAVSGWFAQMQNWFGRGFLILIGIVVVAIALWKATGGPSPAEIVQTVSKA